MSLICAGVSANFGMPRSGPSVEDDGSDQLAVLIVEHDAGAQQARSAVAAARVCAVAEGAVGAVGGRAALERSRISRRTRRIGADRAADSPRRRASAATRAGCCALTAVGNDEQEQKSARDVRA